MSLVKMDKFEYNTGVVNQKFDRGAASTAHGLSKFCKGELTVPHHTRAQEQPQNVLYGYCQCGCGQLAPIAKRTTRKIGAIKGQPLRFVHGHNLTSKYIHLGMPYSPESRFWEKVDRRGNDECWMWLGGVDDKGYGQFWDGKQQCQAHRYSYELHYDKSLGDLLACHSCDNPPCVNPFHLYEGTQGDNLNDMINKGRRYQPDVAGENNGRSKLASSTVREARKKHNEGVSVAALARHYGVDWSTMKAALIGESWSHV